MFTFSSNRNFLLLFLCVTLGCCSCSSVDAAAIGAVLPLKCLRVHVLFARVSKVLSEVDVLCKKCIMAALRSLARFSSTIWAAWLSTRFLGLAALEDLWPRRCVPI
ncbi:hypothetical protein D918_05356 [Trichuris suis]|nr:hypothetical protein D918_05356 [Trichuris suis]